jgi:hydroxymethylpyrimidine pyrophosphatase-like HAD family hydrolase
MLGGDVAICRSARPSFLEVLPAGAGKGAALAKVAEFLKIKREEAVAVGGSASDGDMLRWAGFGVALAGGDDRAKGAADEVSERTKDDDGLAEAIEKHVLAKGGAPR